eukprot:CAMPEP_0181386130 /NCGR_PEP_ID=MMETSP1106-20121128/22960_1 /TAXON_ID=81844 /ORGANISM="Mantoniella antarctica, Strain SL-175" /LENGTH=205 /DNA_ID=CAMNT_0023506299 /DNA_START=214 /DNA_END=830 /DNA_ORIENTATION=+
MTSRPDIPGSSGSRTSEPKSASLPGARDPTEAAAAEAVESKSTTARLRLSRSHSSWRHCCVATAASGAPVCNACEGVVCVALPRSPPSFPWNDRSASKNTSSDTVSSHGSSAARSGACFSFTSGVVVLNSLPPIPLTAASVLVAVSKGLSHGRKHLIHLDARHSIERRLSKLTTEFPLSQKRRRAAALRPAQSPSAQALHPLARC